MPVPLHEEGHAAKPPGTVDLKVLNQNSTQFSGNAFNYAEEFKTVDMAALKADLVAVCKDSKSWWPADYGHYGPFFCRMAWHSAGTYRIHDGRGGANTGNQRFPPLDSWPDNGNLDKARRLLWPIKKKYGRKVSWADLMILAANVGMEDMGFKTFGFAGGREDIWEPEADIWWGPESVMLSQERYASHEARTDGDAGSLEAPLGAVQMGLIYVNPEGPGGNPDPLQAAHDIRVTFGRMAMNDEETVALIAGGHTFGKAHGATNGDKHVGPEPVQATMAEQGFGWSNTYESGKGEHAITSGLEGAWTANPTKWDNGYFHNLFTYNWELGKVPGGASQWYPTDAEAKDTVPDAHNPAKKHVPTMFTTDMALRMDPAYEPIARRFFENPDQFTEAFGRAWYKLCHRDMGPVSRLVGPEVPPAQLWQDPVPAHEGPLIDAAGINEYKGKIKASGLSIADLVRTAWASASTYRCTDHRGGANGARIALAPQKDWAANAGCDAVIAKLNEIKGGDISLADLIVLAGCSAVEAAAELGGCKVEVPFTPGRTDATQEMTDVESFAVLEPTSDGFRNSNGTVHSLVDKAHMLTLKTHEMTALVGGLRVLNANAGGSKHGVFTARPEQLTNDFFVNLCDMATTWKDVGGGVFEVRDADSGELRWTGTEVDLFFGSNAEVRAVAEWYGQDDAKQDFANDFAAAFAKVMNLDRFDVK